MRFKIFDDKGRNPLPRNRMVALLLGWSLLVPALCHAVLGDAPHFVILAVISSLCALALPDSLRLTARAVIYIFVGALVVAFVFSLVYEVDVDHFFLPAETLFPFLILLGYGLSLLDQRPAMISAALSCSLLALLVQGSCLSSPNNVRFLLKHEIFQNRFMLYGICVVAQSYSILHLPKYASHSKRGDEHESINAHIRRVTITTISTVMLFALTIGFAYGARAGYQRFAGIFDDSYREYLKRNSRTKIFSSEVTMDETLTWKSGRLNQVALFIRSDIPPGYMRGRIYRRYKDGKWFSDGEPESLGLRSRRGTYSTSIQGKSDGLEQVDVYLGARFSSDVLYLNGNAEGLELIADRIARSPDGVYLPAGWDISGGYRYFVPKLDQGAAYQAPAEPDKSYLEVPFPLDADIFAVSQEIVSVDEPVRKRIQAITEYLKNNYEYSLKGGKRTENDPILDFLETRKAGHCELFATAAALLLRSKKVKTRYVTGFVCFESRTGDTWVARHRDCHAWLEAWVPDEGWVTIEATPASGVPNTGEMAFFARARNAMQTYLSLAMVAIKRGYFAAGVVRILGWIWRTLKWLLISGPWFISWPLLCAILWYARKRRRRKRDRTVVSLPEFAALQETIISFLNRNQVRYSVSMSLRDIAAATADADVPRATELQALLLEYETLRYAAKPDEKKVELFSDRLSSWVKQAC